MVNNQNTANTSFIGKRMTFLQMIDDYKIVIPVIQRDYAQGRETERVTEIRKNFVKNLISYIKDPSQQFHDLDYIYGTVNQIASTQISEFIPLDGQQRLTTLFLFYLYVAGRKGEFKSFSTRMKAADGTYKFSYKTRSSSTMFCEQLLQEFSITEINEKTGKEEINDTDIFELLKKKEGKNGQGSKQNRDSYISEVIKNQGWFYLSWLNDPTVAGMLVMLDEIDTQFINDPDSQLLETAYKRLFTDDKTFPPVSFQMLPLNGYSRTDDLYIKLNARGLHLSDFENFKARIEELMKDNKLNCFKDFKEKIDMDWNEYLWQFRNGADNTDAILENLFRNFIAFSYRVDKYDKTIVGERMAYLLEQNNKTMRFTFSKYCELEVFHDLKTVVDKKRKDQENRMIEKIIAFFDIFCNDVTTPENAKCNWLDAKKFITNRIIDKSSSYSDRLRLYAYLQYYNTHNRNSIDSDDLNKWMRFVRNLDEATDIDAPENFYQAITSLDELLTAIGCKKVQEWLSSTAARSYKISFFRQREMKEECIKAELIAREKGFCLNTIQTAVEAGDNNDYLKGQMGFALEFAGAYASFHKNQIQTMSQTDIQKLGNRIREYLDKTIALLNILRSTPPGIVVKDRLLERALLTLGMYLRGDSANRWNFCNDANDQYNSWKTLLFVEPGNAYCRKIFKDMLNRISIGSEEKDLNSIISSATTNIPKWRRMLIDNISLINYCEKGFLYIEDVSKVNNDDADIILLSVMQMNGFHSELFSRELYERRKADLRIKYHQQNRYDVDTTVYIAFAEPAKPDDVFEFRLWHWNGVWEHMTSDKEEKNISGNFSYGITSAMDGDQILDQVLKYLTINNYTIVK